MQSYLMTSWRFFVRVLRKKRGGTIRGVIIILICYIARSHLADSALVHIGELREVMHICRRLSMKRMQSCSNDYNSMSFNKTRAEATYVM